MGYGNPDNNLESLCTTFRCVKLYIFVLLYTIVLLGLEDWNTFNTQKRKDRKKKYISYLNNEPRLLSCERILCTESTTVSPSFFFLAFSEIESAVFHFEKDFCGKIKRTPFPT
jgi:hypothetical protein